MVEGQVGVFLPENRLVSEAPGSGTGQSVCARLSQAGVQGTFQGWGLGGLMPSAGPAPLAVACMPSPVLVPAGYSLPPDPCPSAFCSVSRVSACCSLLPQAHVGSIVQTPKSFRSSGCSSRPRAGGRGWAREQELVPRRPPHPGQARASGPWTPAPRTSFCSVRLVH